MSSKYNPVRTNRTPWTDVLTMIKTTEERDAAGYTTATESENEILCTFAEGVSRTEFYEGMKAGIRLTAQAEVWADDFEKERLCEFEGVRYEIIRTWATGRGTVMLSLAEVVR